MNDQTKKILLIGGAAFIALWYLKKKGGQVVDALNPANQNNVVNKAVTSVYQDITGSTGTIGTDLYDFFNPPQPEEIKIISNKKTYVNEIFTGNKQNGWRYFDDGTVIDKWGRYWKDGVLVWSPT